ncbi:MAG TPA: universal stress protein [Candidatus Thermoplasmatota archaeon]
MVNILFPIDGSKETYTAVDRALGILKPGKESTVTFLCVMSKGLRDMPEDAREYLEYDDEDELFLRDDEAKAAIKKAEDIAKTQKIAAKVVPLVREGRVNDMILEEAKKNDLLVMHGLRRDEKEDRKHGNMTEMIARAAGVDVLLIWTD